MHSGFNVILMTQPLVAAGFLAYTIKTKAPSTQIEQSERTTSVRVNTAAESAVASVVTGRGLVPLSVVAEVEMGRGVSRINRENGVPSVTAQGTIDTSIANANAIVSDTLARFVPDLLVRYPGIEPDVEGPRAEATKT